MAEINLQKTPQGFRESNVEHLTRKAEVIIIKKLRNFKVPEAGEKETQIESFKREYFEFTGTNGILKPNETFNEKWAVVEEGITTQLYSHYQVTIGGSIRPGKKDSVSDVSVGIANEDVYSINCILNTEGRGKCTLILNSREDKYIFKSNPVKKGDTCFDSNDLIFVNLTGLDNVFHRVFTGKITTVTQEVITTNTLQTLITLECDDMLKPLFETRTNVKPSLNIPQAKGVAINGLNSPFLDKAPHEILANSFGRAYSDFYTVPHFLSDLTFIRSKAKNGTEDQRKKSAIDEEDKINDLLTLFSPPESGVLFDDFISPFLAVEAAAKKINLPEFFGQTAKVSGESIRIPKRIYGFKRQRQPIEKTNPTSFDFAINSGSILEGIANADDVAFIIDGTEQPTYQLAFTGQTELFASEWKSALVLASEITQNINFELFADETGIVHFRPLNISLPFDFYFDEQHPTISKQNPLIQSTNKLSSEQLLQGRVGNEYWLNQQFISYQRYQHTDEGIFTIAYTIGDLQQGSISSQIYAGVAADAQKYLTLGERVAPQITKLNLTDSRACEVYAKAYLARLNANARSASITYMGDSRLRVGNPCYLPHKNSVYYIASLSHNFVAGQSYTTTLNLKYGRKPLAVIPERIGASKVKDTNILNAINANTLDKVLDRIANIDDSDVVVATLIPGGSVLADYIQKNSKNLTFNEFVWEPMFTLSYEELAESLYVYSDLISRKETAESALLHTQNFRANLQQQRAVLQKAVNDVRIAAEDLSVISVNSSDEFRSVTEEAAKKAAQNLLKAQGNWNSNIFTLRKPIKP